VSIALTGKKGERVGRRAGARQRVGAALGDRGAGRGGDRDDVRSSIAPAGSVSFPGAGGRGRWRGETAGWWASASGGKLATDDAGNATDRDGSVDDTVQKNAGSGADSKTSA